MPAYVRGVRLRELPPEESYLAHLPMVQDLYRQGGVTFTANVTFLVGENGTGKSTLLEALAVELGFNAEGGTRNFSFSTKETHSPLHRYLTVVKEPARPQDGFFLRAESFYNAASYLDQLEEENPHKALRSYGGVSLHACSHGESFLALVQNRFSGHGLYLLDEPEAALSPARQMTLLVQMHHLVGQGSQFLVASHSPILMAYPGAQVLELTQRGIQDVPYQETEHYRLTKRFLNDPQRMLHYLLEESEE